MINKNETGAAFGSSLRKIRGCWIPILCGIGITLFFGACFSEAATAKGGRPKATSARLADMSIEDLVDVEVISLTSLFKKSTKLDQAPAAAAVVTQDDIRRLGRPAVHDGPLGWSTHHECLLPRLRKIFQPRQPGDERWLRCDGWLAFRAGWGAAGLGAGRSGQNHAAGQRLQRFHSRKRK